MQNQGTLSLNSSMEKVFKKVFKNWRFHKGDYVFFNFKNDLELESIIFFRYIETEKNSYQLNFASINQAFSQNEKNVLVLIEDITKIKFLSVMPTKELRKIKLEIFQIFDPSNNSLAFKADSFI